MSRFPSSSDKPHIPIMLSEVLHAFADVDLLVFYEGTLGAGGHAEAILKAHPEIERYIACDKDPQALEIASEQLSLWKDKIELVHGDFADLDLHLKERGINQVDGFFLT